MRFEIDPRVVFRLGEDLISDDAQAIAELVKNAYDADSPWVKVRVDTEERVESVHGGESLTGSVTIEDAGSGMTPEQIEHGWLRIAVSEKRAMKEAGKTTKQGRTPLGDKGLGRLGAQRLGQEIELVTKAARTGALRVRFSWADFARFDTLGRVPVKADKVTRSRTGTTVRLLGLRQREYWKTTGEEAKRRRLLQELSNIISPYEGVGGFAVAVAVDGIAVDLFELTARLRSTAQVHYRLDYDGEQLAVRGQLRLAFLQPNRRHGSEVENFRRFALSDSGAAFRTYLARRPSAQDWGFREPRSSKVFLECRWTIGPDDVGELYVSDGASISPGRFHGEVDGYDLGHASVSEQDVFSTAAQYREIIRSIAGVRVYRDGFHVRTDRDPLGLARGSSSARGSYALRPETTSGYLAISARDNAALVEKTDREGFQDTPAFRNLVELLKAFSDDVDSIHNEVRRSWTAYLRERLGTEADAEDEDATEGAAESLAEHLADARVLATRVAGLSARIPSVVSQSEEAVEAEADSTTLAAATHALGDLISEARELFIETEAYLGRITAVASVPIFLGVEISELRDQVVLSQETMSLGITAEALVHELMNVCDQLESRAAAAVDQVEGGTLAPAVALSFADFVRSASRGLRKQAAHLQPGLRYVRDRKDRFGIHEFLTELADHYASRWHGSPLALAVKGRGDFRVEMNRGKLTQIFDNLILNSEYWLRESIRRGANAGTATVEASKPTVIVSDTGPGIAPQRANRIFDPFVSGKPDGRGLGLFIVRQLLDSEGCAIYLGDHTNRRGNYDTFVIDLGGALAD